MKNDNSTKQSNASKPMLANRLLKFRTYYELDNEIQYWHIEITQEEKRVRSQQISTNGKILAVVQFTGLIDKNSCEIFEGDILELPNGTKGIVKWLECGFVLKLKGETIWQNLLFNVSNHYLRIGNIHES